MRKHEITDELIRLSKLAKELGFPQVVESGQWVWSNLDQEMYCAQNKIPIDLREAAPEEVLILSFSRCLEWAKGNDLVVTMDASNDGADFVSIWASGGEVRGRAKVHHEAIAKAVVKMLEAEQCK